MNDAAAHVLHSAALLQLLLSDDGLYSQLTPWVLSSDSAPLSDWAERRPALQQLPQQFAALRPHDLRAAIAGFLAEQCEQLSVLADRGPCAACSSQAGDPPTTSGCPACTHGGHRPLPSPAKQQQHSAAVASGGGLQDVANRGGRLPDESRLVDQQLPRVAARVAKLHGHLLAHGFIAPVMQEVATLISILLGVAAPQGSSGGGSDSCAGRAHPAKQQDAGDPLPSPDQAQVQLSRLLCCSVTAARYAAKALTCTGRLLVGLGPQLSSQLASTSAVQVHAPQLARMLRQQHQQPQQHHQQPQHQQDQRSAEHCQLPHSAGQQGARTVGSAAAAAATSASSCPGNSAAYPAPPGASPFRRSLGGVVDAAGASPFVAVGMLKAQADLAGKATARAPGEAQRIRNREACRDAFFGVLREANAKLAALQQRAQQQEALPAPALQAQPHAPQQQHQQQRLQASPGIEAWELLAAVRGAMRALLHRLQPSNLPQLGDLFCACVLQAAATGEPLADARLAQLAQQDPSRFQKLHQRLQRADSSSSGTCGGASSGSGGAASTRGHGAAGRGSQGRDGGGGTALGRAGAGSAAAAPGSAAAGLVQGAPLGGCARGGGASRQLFAGSHAPQPAPGALPQAPQQQLQHAQQQALPPPLHQQLLQQQEGDALLQLLDEFPVSQRVFVLILEAADSVKLSHAVCQSMLHRVQTLLSTPAAAGGSASTAPNDSSAGAPTTTSSHPHPSEGGRGPAPAARSTGALGNPCLQLTTLGQHLSFLAFCRTRLDGGGAGSSGDEGLGDAEAGRQLAPWLATQGAVDAVAALGAALGGGACCISGSGATGSTWSASTGGGGGDARVLALTVPFVCSYLWFLPPAAHQHLGSRPAAALQLLHQLQSLPELQPCHPGFTQLHLCVRSSAEQLFCRLGLPHAAAAGGAGAPSQQCAAAPALAAAAVGQLSALRPPPADAELYASLCCPVLAALQQQVSAAQVGAAALPGGGLAGTRAQQQGSKAHAEGLPQRQQPAPAAAAGRPDQQQRHQDSLSTPAKKAPLASQGRPHAPGGGAPSATAPARTPTKQTPLQLTPHKPQPPKRRQAVATLVAPRQPPQPPPCVAAALAGPDPQQLQLQRAFLQQYSAEEQIVKMSDVVAVVSDILAAQAFLHAMQRGVPDALAAQLRSVEADARARLQASGLLAPPAPAPAGNDGGARDQEVARVVTTATALAQGAAVTRTLEAAQAAATQHVHSAAPAALTALLPADTPGPVAATAAAVAAGAALAACAQRLMQQVPHVVQSQLSQQGENLVRQVAKERGLAARLGVAGAASSHPAAPSTTTHSSSDSSGAQPPAGSSAVGGAGHSTGHAGATHSPGMLAARARSCPAPASQQLPPASVDAAPAAPPVAGQLPRPRRIAPVPVAPAAMGRAATASFPAASAQPPPAPTPNTSAGAGQQAAAPEAAAATSGDAGRAPPAVAVAAVVDAAPAPAAGLRECCACEGDAAQRIAQALVAGEDAAAALRAAAGQLLRPGAQPAPTAAARFAAMGEVGMAAARQLLAAAGGRGGAGGAGNPVTAAHEVLEGRLVEMLQAVAAAAPPAAPSALAAVAAGTAQAAAEPAPAAPAGSGGDGVSSSGCGAASGGDGGGGGPDQADLASCTHQLGVLVAAAVVCCDLANPGHVAATWLPALGSGDGGGSTTSGGGGGGSGAGSASSGGNGQQHQQQHCPETFRRVMGVLMKQVQAGFPAGVLAHIRRWLLAATMGCWPPPWVRSM